jgi:hypothetical protein
MFYTCPLMMLLTFHIVLSDCTCILCDDCDPLTVPKTFEGHTFDHPFLRVPPPADNGSTTGDTEHGNIDGPKSEEGGALAEDRMTRLEERIGRLEELLQRIVDKA